METTKKVVAMAFTRSKWIDMFRRRFTGALKEYTKLYIVKQLGLKSFWDKEVNSLAKHVVELIDPTRRKGSWDVYIAAAEAFLDVCGEQAKCKEALKDFKDYDEYTEGDIKKIYRFWAENVPDSEDLSLEILKTYFPKQHSERILKEIHNLTK